MNIIRKYLSCCFKSNLVQLQSSPKNSNISIHKKIEMIIKEIHNYNEMKYHIIFYSRYRDCFFSMSSRDGDTMICILQKMNQFKDYDNIILYRFYCYDKDTLIRLYSNHLGIISTVYKVDIEAIL